VLTCPNCGRESPEGYAFCPACAAPLALAAPAREVRKTVTVVFSDLTGSTALGERLDPESLRDVQSRYFDAMRQAIEHHGGTVEKYIGDAVMAVFGIPRLHEDDAMRAARAAVDMRDGLTALNKELERDRGVTIAVRIGVNTGEVVAGDPAAGQALVTGDAVNVAARLEQAAAPGEVLIGQPTLVLVRDAADVEPIEPLELRGKAEPVSAYRLLRVHDAPERRHGELFVGRERELAILLEAWERVWTEQRCELVTVAGDAGVGKSRLATEVLATIEARVLRGRCLPYGEGITYWPVVEVLRQLDVLPPEEAASEAIRSLLGETEAVTSAEEIAWAFRKTLEHAAAERPLVVVFDDIQWGEETFLDLIEHIAPLSSGSSILLLCMARPELNERRPTWAVTLRLEPLGEEDVDELIPKRIPGKLRERIAQAAGGNPLFIEEMLAMAGDADGEVIVPPTLHALLAARLDQLETAERSVLERGAIEGEIFHRGAVQALAPNEIQVTPHLAALVRKELIRPDTPQLAGEDGFRFRHLLIRDAAYDALPKATRADLHVRFASWFEQHGTELVELDEILGYHLEQACEYRAELGMPDDKEMAGTARRRLTAAGFRANLRQDYDAAVSLLERAAALAPPTEFDLALETELGVALVWTGRAGDALRRADALAEHASATGDRVGDLCGRIQGGVFRLELEPEGATEKLAALVEQALPVFQAADDDLALYVAYAALFELEETRGRNDAGLEAYERAYAHARHAGYVPPGSFGIRAYCRFAGTTPVPELLAWLDQNEAQEGRDYFFRAYRAGALAMLGRFDKARAILAEARAELAERGGGILLANITAFESVWVELWAGDPAAAAEFGAEGFRLHEELGDPGGLALAAGNLAQPLYALDRLDEAYGWTVRSEELGSSDDALKEMHWRRVRAKVLARRGEHADAERLALEAVAICEETDWLDAQGDVYADVAEVHLLAGRAEESAEALEQALARYERKGNVVMAARTRSRLEATGRGTPAADSA
jgi:class 3 adenylate cyclase/tetratricopeptide (TPR) repeat protein